MKIGKRVLNVLGVFNGKEIVNIFINHFLLKRLFKTNPQLFNLFVFTLASSDKGYNLSYRNNLVYIEVEREHRKVNICIRKFTRDIYVFEQIFINEDYLPLVNRLKSKAINTPLKFIDAGANIGCSSMYFLLHFPSAQILCIEPETSNYELALKNFQLNNFTSQVKVLKSALWVTNTFLDLQQRDTSHDGFHIMTKETSDLIIDRVPTCTVDQLYKELGTTGVDLFKIDIEGAEKSLIEDPTTLNLILSNTEVLAIEVHEEFISEQYVSTVLKDHGFSVEKSGEYLIAY